MTKWEKRGWILGASLMFAFMFPFYPRDVMKRAWANVMKRVK